MKDLVLYCVLLTTINGLQTGNSNSGILFKYTADFRTGIYDRKVYGSQFILKADLHGQYHSDSHSVILYFSNPLISLYNGDLQMEGGGTQNLNYLPLIYDAAAFEEPFIIEYPEQSADIDAIFTENDEPKWIINIKKSVGSLFQFDWKTFDMNINKTMPYTFHSEENSLYGKCLVTYTVEPEDDLWIVNKQQDPSQCSHFSSLTVSNLIETPCGNHSVNDNNIVTENRRIYQVNRNGSEPHLHIFKNIVTSGKVFFNPFRENGEVKYANVIQTVEFAKYQEPKQITFRQKIKHDIELDFHQHNETEIVFASTFLFTMSEINDSSYTNLEKCVKGIENLSVNISDANAYNYIVRTLSHFTTDDFEICANQLISNYSDISLNHIDILYKLVPIVGTRASANFIKNVIKTSRIKFSIAISMVEFMPFYILAPTEELLVDLIEFIDFNFDVSSDIKSAAILAYATLISRTFNSNPESKYLKKYIIIYYKNLKSAETYSDQLIWLQGLKNINLSYVWKMLLPIIRGDQLLHLKHDHRLQIQAIWGTSSQIRENQIVLNNVLWPIVINRKAHPEIRVAAMYVYIMGINSSRELSNIFWYMQTETNPQVLNYFRTLLKTFADGTQHCSNAMTVYAKQALNYLKKLGQDSETYAFAYDHIEQEFGFGGKIHGTQMAASDNIPSSVLLNVEGYAMKKTFNLFSFYIRLNHIHPRYLFISSPPDKEIEIICKINNKVISAKVYERSNTPTILDFFQSKKNEFINILDLLNSNTILPSDIGLPIVLQFKMPMITRIEWKNNFESISFHFQQSLLGSYGTALYNPFANVWHGVMREIQFNINLPLKFKPNLILNKISVMFNKYVDDNFFHAFTKVRTVVFLINLVNSSVLLDYCPHCPLHKSITEVYGDKRNFEKIVPLQEIGLDCHLKVSECTGYNGREYKDVIKNSFKNIDLTNLNSISWPKFGIYFINLVGLHFASPKIHSCTQSFLITKSHFHDVNEISLHYDPAPYVRRSNKIRVLHFMPRILIINSNITKLWEGDFYSTPDNPYDYYCDISRTVDNEPTFNLCFNYKKRFFNDIGFGEFNLFEGLSESIGCVKDNFFLKVSWEGQRSTEQLANINKTHTYRDCGSNTDYFSVCPLLSYACVKAHTSLRNYTYIIEYNNVPSQYSLGFNSIWDLIKRSHNYGTKHENDKMIRPNNLLLQITQPIHYEDTRANVKIHFQHITYSFENVNYFDFLFPLENTHIFSNLYEPCVVRVNDNIIVDGSFRGVLMPENNKWFIVSSYDYDFDEDKWTIEAKQLDNNYLAIKIRINNYTITVDYDANSNNSKFIYGMNNEMQEAINSSPNNNREINPLNPYNIKIQIIKDSFVFLSQKYGIFIIYNGKYIKTEGGLVGDKLCCRYQYHNYD